MFRWWRFVGFFFIASATPANACTCIGPSDLATDFKEADIVFRGMPIKITRRPLVQAREHEKWSHFTEDVTFVVTKAWKNTKVGEQITTHATVGGGFCDQTVINDSGWEEEAELKVPVYRPFQFALEWIVYAGGPPYVLNGCSRSERVIAPKGLAAERALDDFVNKQHR